MNDDFPHPIPMPPPAMIQLPSPPHEVTDGVAALRVACAKWAPSPGASDHKSELQACDTVLNRNTDSPCQFGLLPQSSPNTGARTGLTIAGAQSLSAARLGSPRSWR